MVGYLHDWIPDPKSDAGGEFIWYDSHDGKLQSLPANPLAGNVMDGSKTIHAARVYYPNRPPPFIDRNKDTVLSYVGNEQWQVCISHATRDYV